jgi:hypothetical protein
MGIQDRGEMLIKEQALNVILQTFLARLSLNGRNLHAILENANVLHGNLLYQLNVKLFSRFLLSV